MSTALTISFRKPVNQLQDRTLLHIKGSVGAEFAAAEAADAGSIVDGQQLPLDADGPRGAGIPADTAEDTLFRDGARTGSEMVPQPVLEEAGKTELNIGQRRQA